MSHILCSSSGGTPICHGSWWQHQNPKRPAKLKAVSYDEREDRVLLELDPREMGRTRLRWVARKRFLDTAGYFPTTAPLPPAVLTEGNMP